MKKLACLLAGALSACVTLEEVNQRYMEEVRNRAAFDLSCDPQSIHESVLAQEPYGRPYVKTIGVEACGHRATYVRVGTTWVMDNGGAGGAAVAEQNVEQQRALQQQQLQQQVQQQQMQQQQQQQQQMMMQHH
jgi:hypothetical protein